MTDVEVLFTPAEFEALSTRDLSEVVCVVFDVLRATSSMVTALGNGASGIFPVAEIEDALALKRSAPGLLLAGERGGLRIRAQDGTLFDLGNSPREFTQERIGGREVAMTTTNGTRALMSCRKARNIFVSAFLNLSATARAVLASSPAKLLLICGGTFAEAAYEDVLGAGALIAALRAKTKLELADSALLALKAWQLEETDVVGALKQSRNGRRLLAVPDLAADVEFCAGRDRFELVARLRNDGSVRSTDLNAG